MKAYKVLAVELPLPAEGELEVQLSVGIALIWWRTDVGEIGPCFDQVKLSIGSIQGEGVDIAVRNI